MKQLIILLLVTGLVSCRSFETMRWGECTDSDGAGLSADLVALFDWSDRPDMIVSIDGNRCLPSGPNGYTKAKLKPGAHVIEYSNHVHDLGHAGGRIELELKEGHLYAFRFATCYWCRNRRFTAWVDDTTTGEVVWGKRPDWPSWYL